MSDIIEHFVFKDGIIKKNKSQFPAQPSIKTIESNKKWRRIRRSSILQNDKKFKHVKKYVADNLTYNEIYHIIQALLLTLSIMVLGYHSVWYGSMEYSLLENGQIVNGLVPPRKAVVILSIGYPMQYAIICVLTACMLLYSLVSAEPQWSLPLIVLTLADLVSNVGDAIVAFWLLFTKLQLYTAAVYTTVTSSIILGQFWVWLGVLRLYELRTF